MSTSMPPTPKGLADKNKGTKAARKSRTVFQTRYLVGLAKGQISFAYVSMCQNPQLIRASAKDPSNPTHESTVHTYEGGKLVTFDQKGLKQKLCALNMQVRSYPSGVNTVNATVFSLHPGWIREINDLQENLTKEQFLKLLST